ncbi:MAG: hypothetical protein ACXVP5_02985 [Tumebacillaceae bacterium]
MGLQIQKKLLEIALPQLAPHGFQYDKQNSKNSLWIFKRVENEIDQLITFDQSRLMPTDLRVTFSTSNDWFGIEGCHLVPGHDTWWMFHDEASLESVINEFVSLALTDGLYWFEVSERPIPKASMQVAQQLFQEHNPLAKSFENQYGIQYVDATTLKVVEQILKEASRNAEEVEWDLILRASAYLGEMVRENLQGEWRWREKTGLPVLDEIGGNPKLAFSPLSYVSTFWANPYERLQSKYERLQRGAEMI